MVVIGTSVWFEAAHRQYGDPGKCGKLHGHNWRVDIKIDSEVVDEIGYVVDFKSIEDMIDQFDHSVILIRGDPLIDILTEANQKVMVIDANPTCENLAVDICYKLFELVEDNIRREPDAIRVVVWENDVSYAKYGFGELIYES